MDPILAFAKNSGALILVLVLVFAAAAGPSEIDSSIVFIAIIISIIFSAPLWILGSIPKRQFEKFVAYRWLVALALIIPIQVFGGSLITIIERSIISRKPNFFGLVCLVPTVFCFICMGYLVWPEVSKLLPNSSSKQDS
jgi:hypothetical protein